MSRLTVAMGKVVMISAPLYLVYKTVMLAVTLLP